MADCGDDRIAPSPRATLVRVFPSAPTPPRRDHLTSLRTGLGTITVACVIGVAAVLGGCSTAASEEPDAERFCGEISVDPAAVVAPTLDSVESLNATLEHYRLLADLAPIGISDDWQVLVDTFETATTVVPRDPVSMQRLMAEAYAMERSAVTVHAWVLNNCGVDLGPVTTLVPHGPSVTTPDGELFEEGPDGQVTPLTPIPTAPPAD